MDTHFPLYCACLPPIPQLFVSECTSAHVSIYCVGDAEKSVGMHTSFSLLCACAVQVTIARSKKCVDTHVSLSRVRAQPMPRLTFGESREGIQEQHISVNRLERNTFA